MKNINTFPTMQLYMAAGCPKETPFHPQGEDPSHKKDQSVITSHKHKRHREQKEKEKEMSRNRPVTLSADQFLLPISALDTPETGAAAVITLEDIPIALARR